MNIRIDSAHRQVRWLAVGILLFLSLVLVHAAQGKKSAPDFDEDRWKRFLTDAQAFETKRQGCAFPWRHEIDGVVTTTIDCRPAAGVIDYKLWRAVMADA